MKPTKYLYLILLAMMLCSVTAVAQSRDEQTPQAIEGLGSIAFPTSTDSIKAQNVFNRGMLLLHLFEYDDAAEAFKKAEALDPGFAMA